MSTPIRPGTESGASYTPDAAMPPKPEQSSLFEDFIDIFHAPSKVFARRANAGFWGPLLVLTVLAAAFTFANRGINSQIFDVEAARGMQKAMADNPQLTAEQMQPMMAIQEKMMAFFGYIGTPIVIFFMAIFGWLAAKIVKAKVSYGQAVMIYTFAWIPRIIEQLTITVQALLMDTSTITNRWDVSLSPARFMDADGPSRMMNGLAGRIDPFTIWTTILLGIGIAVVGGVPRSKGFTAAGILFVLGTLIVMVMSR